jgi:hypothetical protein
MTSRWRPTVADAVIVVQGSATIEGSTAGPCRHRWAAVVTDPQPRSRAFAAARCRSTGAEVGEIHTWAATTKISATDR